MIKRIALVTGAAAGIGAAIAEHLAVQGNHVILADLNYEAANQLAKTLADRGTVAEAVRLDVGDSESIAQGFAWLADTYGRCDILVNNAGIARTYPFVDYPDDHWLATLNINVTGAFR